MKYIKQLLGVTVLTVLVLACNNTPEFVQMESGLKFRKLVEGDKTRTQADQVMNVVMTHTINDSILYDSGDEMGYFMNPQVGLPPNLQEIFLQCGIGDSLQIQMSYLEYTEMTGRPFSPADSATVVTWNIKVREIEKESVIVERIQSEQIALEAGIIEEYLVNNNLEANTTDDGIAVVTLEEGDGNFPKAGDLVKVNYAVRLLDGTLIDTSYEALAKENDIYYEERNYAPYEFTLGNREVIQGWDLAMPYVSKGGKAKLLIPSRHAYGSRNTGGPIPPNSVLVFDVEVVDF